MSNEVRVPFGDSPSDTATLLLAAVAESDDYEVSVVKVDSLGGFIVPEEIAKASGLDYEDPDNADASKYSEEQVAEATTTSEAEPTEVPAKKAAAKKAPAKKTTVKGK